MSCFYFKNGGQGCCGCGTLHGLKTSNMLKVTRKRRASHCLSFHYGLSNICAPSGHEGRVQVCDESFLCAL